MRILIVGASGYVGGRLVALLAADDIDAVAVLLPHNLHCPVAVDALRAVHDGVDHQVAQGQGQGVFNQEEEAGKTLKHGRFDITLF